MWPCDAIWPHRTGSTLVQVMAWCVMAPSHYLNHSKLATAFCTHCWPPDPYGGIRQHWVNILRPRQNGCQFPAHSFKCIFLNENMYISINISLKFVPKGPIDNMPALVQIKARRRPRRQAIIWTNDCLFTMVPTDLEKCLNLNAVLKSAWFFNLPWKGEIFLEKCLKMTLWSWKI